MSISPYNIHAIFAQIPLWKMNASIFPITISMIPIKICLLNVNFFMPVYRLSALHFVLSGIAALISNKTYSKYPFK